MLLDLPQYGTFQQDKDQIAGPGLLQASIDNASTGKNKYSRYAHQIYSGGL
jgi:hypothetical protein